MSVANKPFILMSAIKPQSIHWLWPQRIAMGELTIVDGDPATNKTALLLDLAARVSNGACMPDGSEGVDGGVVLLMSEDSAARTLRPRLDAAGANTDRVAMLSPSIRLPDDLPTVKQAVAAVRAKMIITDPVMAFLGVTAGTDQGVRRAMTPLKEFAEERGVAIILVRHLTKRGDTALYRGGGSIGLIAATRAGFIVARDPNDAARRVLCAVKNNLAPPAPSLLFRPISAANGVIRIAWEGECDYTADSLLAKPAKPKAPKPTRNKAAAFLRVALANGPVEEPIIQAQALTQRITAPQLVEARQQLGVVRLQRGIGTNSVIVWRLPRPKC